MAFTAGWVIGWLGFWAVIALALWLTWRVVRGIWRALLKFHSDP